jgi:uncharacterized protein (TIRG00374 family)
MFSPKTTEWMAKIVTKPLKFVMKEEKVLDIQKNLFDKIDEFHTVSKKLFTQKKVLLKASLITLVQLFLFYSIPFFVLKAFHVEDVSFWFVIALNVILTMAVSIFPIPGGSGGAEYGFKLLFAKFIQWPAQLVLAMFIWRILTYYLGLFAGIIAYNFIPNNDKNKK